MKTRSRRGLYAPELLESRIAPATFTVTSLLDDGSDGTLRKEIQDANAQPGADTILFKIPAALLPGSIVLGGTEIAITEPLTIKGPGIDLVTVNANDLSRIFNINYAAASLKPTTISGLTMTNGKSAAGTDGGAIFSDESLTLVNVVVRNSYAGDEGGGVFVNTVGPGKVSITGSRIVHNTAFDSAGGLYLEAPSVSVVKTTIANNTAGEFGGMLAYGLGPKASVVIDSCTISNNTATAGPGGGIYLFGPDDGKIIVKNSLITGNSAAGGGGGGLFIEEGRLSISKTTFSNNSADEGGAIRNDDAVAVTISGSRFVGNSATLNTGDGGGALYLNGDSLVTITGSLFSNNFSMSYGGAIVAVSTAVTLNVSGSSFLGNTADDYGGAFYLAAASTLTMKSSTLSGNVAALAGGAIYAGYASVINLTGNKLIENRALDGGAIFLDGAAANASTANLKGNLFHTNVAGGGAGAIFSHEDCTFTSKGDKFLGNVAQTGQGGAVNLSNSGGIMVTGSLFQSNVAGSSGGGLLIANTATLTSVKILDNVTAPAGRGGGIRITAGVITMTKSIVTGNVAGDGGGVFYTVGTVNPVELTTTNVIKGNAAGASPNIGSA